MNFEAVGASVVRLVESASDELARLDALCSVAPRAVADHLRLAALAQNVVNTEATPSAHASLVAALVDPVHSASLSPALSHWIQIADGEERRARSGAPLTAARVLAWSASEDVSDLGALDDALRPGGAPRAVLLRAVAARAMVRTEFAELLPALMLCAAGNTDRIRLLPFAALDPQARAESLAAWDEGEEAPFAQLALAECARAARAERQAVAAAIAGLPTEDARLDALGRASITARRALAVLRNAVGATVPSLAIALECSRPAAGDALARLVDLQIAQEVTERGRDRVFVWSSAYRPA